MLDERRLRSTVRCARADEADEIADLVNRAYEVERFFVDHARTTAEEIRALQERGCFLVLDRAGGGLAACVYLETSGERGYFGMLSVDPTMQDHGLGRRLVAVAEAMCAAEGCSAIDLQVVNLRAELPPWYRSLGYRERGTEPFPDDPPPSRPCHFIVMSKQLGW